MSSTHIPDLGDSIRESLEPYRNCKCYFEPLEGNHGDQLILLGSNAFLASYNFQFVESPGDAELIVINGGGGMFIDRWSRNLTRWKSYAEGYRSTPIVVLPSSYWFADLDFRGTLIHREAPTTLFCRERGSFGRLNDLNLPSDTQIKLDHDMAFHLANLEPVVSARRVPERDFVLVVERFDDEQGTGPRMLSAKNFKWAWKLPSPVKRVGKAALAFARGRTSQLLKEAKNTTSLFPEFPANIEYKYIDVSNEHKYTFDFFVTTVAEARGIVTTRLHAGILAAMLGKPTLLKDGSEYKKLSTIYEYSMKDWPHVRVLE